MNYINSLSTYRNINQSTLKNKISFSGVGVHNGRAVSMCIEPADLNTGIVFIRTDVKDNNIIRAVIENTVDTSLCT